MGLHELPVVGRVLAFGPDDTLYDSLILLGPVVVVVVSLAGLSPLTEAVAGAYVVAFVLVTLYRAGPVG